MIILHSFTILCLLYPNILFDNHFRLWWMDCVAWYFAQITLSVTLHIHLSPLNIPESGNGGLQGSKHLENPFAVLWSLNPVQLFATPQTAVSQALFYPKIGLPRVTKISSSSALSRDLETVITVLISCHQKLYLSTANNGKTSSLLCNKCSLVDKNHVKCGTQWGINKDIQVSLKMQINKQQHSFWEN